MLENARHVTVYRDPFAYCAHAHLVLTADGSLVAVFNKVPRRAVTLHPPEDPLYQNMVIRSTDGGESWSAPQPVPGHNWAGVECAGLTCLDDGRLMLNQWQFGWLTAGEAVKRADQTGLTYARDLLAGWSRSPEHDTAAVDVEQLVRASPWVRGPGRTFVHFSDDNGASFGETVELAVAPFSGGYGMRGAVQMPDGRILLPLSDVPNYRVVFLTESSDGGQSWSAARRVAGGADHAFEEPAIVACGGGRLVMVMRDNETRCLHQSVSNDAGISWSAPSVLPIQGYPAHLLRLQDGRLLMTYGWRQPGYGIRAVWSHDNGDNWQTDQTILIRDDMRNGNLGYPATIMLSDGRFFTIYYGEEPDGVTAVLGTFWQ